VESVSFSGRAECDLTTNGSNLSERSAGLEKEDSNLTEIEVDEVLGLVGHIWAEVTADNAMPGGVVLLVEFLLDESCNILLNVELLEGLGGDVDSVLLHIFGHVCVLHNGLAVCHILMYLR
jgi:hypothetical protein